MGRGALSKSIRAQQRANASGNPNRANAFSPKCTAFRHPDYGDQIKLIVHEGAHYAIGFSIDGFALRISDIMLCMRRGCGHYPSVQQTDPLFDVLCRKLLITLNVEKAKKAR